MSKSTTEKKWDTLGEKSTADLSMYMTCNAMQCKIKEKTYDDELYKK